MPRYSCEHTDPGWSNYHRQRMKSVRILLDGKDVTEVITADEEQGYILRHKTDDNGHILINFDAQETLKEELHGKVKVKFR